MPPEQLTITLNSATLLSRDGDVGASPAPLMATEIIQTIKQQTHSGWRVVRVSRNNDSVEMVFARGDDDPDGS